MKIEKNKIVSVTYELKVMTGENEGNVIEVSDESNPLVFPYGLNMLLPAFESALYGKESGDKFDVGMDVDHAYGNVNNSMIVNISKSVFLVDGKIDDDIIKVGNRLPMMSEDGNMMEGLVSSIGENEIVMDFNHPLAGKALHFTGEIIEVRDATEEELAGINMEDVMLDEDCEDCDCDNCDCDDCYCDEDCDNDCSEDCKHK